MFDKDDRYIRYGSLAYKRIERLCEAGRWAAASAIVVRRGGIEMPTVLRAEILKLAHEARARREINIDV